jgi:hypothetical protein
VNRTILTAKHRAKPAIERQLLRNAALTHGADSKKSDGQGEGSDDMKLFSTWIHSVLDYVTVGTLLALPRGLRWGKPVTLFVTASALGSLAYSLLTRYELGVFKRLPMQQHLLLDAMSGAAFCAAPLLLKHKDSDVKKAMLGLGLFELSAALLTDPQTEDNVNS